MRPPSLLPLLPLLPLLGSALAAPHAELDSHSLSPVPPSWRRLSDAIIRSIWSLPASDHPHTSPSALSTPPSSFTARYADHVVLRFTLASPADATALADAIDILFLDVWEFNADWADIRIEKNVVASLLGLLPASLRHAHQPLMQDLDLARAVFDSYPTSSAATQPYDAHADTHAHAPRPAKGHPFLNDYQPLSVISPWMDLMASMFATHVRRISLGTSYEGRDMSALRIGVHPTNNNTPTRPRKTVLITAGSHAREWISTSTVNYIAWSLINAYGKDRETTRLLEDFDFVLVPTLNPDGYVYSWETDRLWRKNRQPTPLRFCHGIDLDRSYAFQWDGDAVRTNPCSESYAGDAPFEAAEARQFADWAKNETENNNVDFVGFLDLHSYSQQILYPYSYSCADAPPALEDLEELAIGLAKAMRVSRKGHPYKVTSACEGNVLVSDKNKNKHRTILPRLESSGGSALDYFYHDLKVKYSFQIKLRDTGSYGFLLPRSAIAPTGQEVLDAVLYFGRFMMGHVGLAAEAPANDASHSHAETPADDDDDDDNEWVIVDDDSPDEDEVMEL